MMTNLSFANSLYLRFLGRDATDTERQTLTKEIDDKKQEDSDYESFDATSDFVANNFDTQHIEDIEQYIKDYYEYFNESPSLEELLDWADDESDISSDEAEELKGILGYDSYADQLYKLDNPLEITSPGALSSDENESLDYVVSTTGADSDDLIYTLNDSLDDDSHLFTIDAETGELSFKELPDFEDKKVYKLTVFVTDVGTSIDSYKEIIIKINDVDEDINEAPEFTSATTANADENSTQSFYSATAIDSDPLSYAINNQTDKDNALFSINANTGELAFKEAQDFEANENRTYLVDITVTDGVIDSPVIQEVSVTLNDLNEAPSFTSALTAIAFENSTDPFYTATAIDPEAEPLAFSINNQSDKDNALFSIDADTGELAFKDPQDFEDEETNPLYQVDIRVTDGVTPVVQEVSVSLNDLTDPVLKLSTLQGSSALTVIEGELAEYKITLASGNIQVGDTLVFTLDAVNGVGEFGALNPEDFSNFIDLDTASYTYVNTFDQAVSAGDEILVFSLATVEDGLFESTEAFSIDLHNASIAGDTVVVSGSPLTTLIENKRVAELTLMAADGSNALGVTEGDLADYKVVLTTGNILAGETLSFTLESKNGVGEFGAVNPDDFSDFIDLDTAQYTYTHTFDADVIAGEEILLFGLATEADDLFEATEAFSIELSAASMTGGGLADTLTVAVDGSPLVTEIENQRHPQLSLIAADGGDSLTVLEGDIAAYKIVLSSDNIQAGETLSFTLTAENGLGEFGAVNPDDFSDFIDLNGTEYTYTHTFTEAVAVGAEILLFSLATKEDNLLEETEAFSILLDAITLEAASLEPLSIDGNGSPLTTFIQNKVNNYQLTLSGDTTSVEGGTANYSIYFTGDDLLDGDVLELTLDTSNGLALTPDDFSGLSGTNYDPNTKKLTLTGPISSSSTAEIATLSVDIVDDLLFEGQEDFSVILSSAAVNGQFTNIAGSPVATTIASSDPDITAPIVQFGQSASYAENSGTEVLLQVQASDVTAIVGDFESGVASFQISTGNDLNYFQINNLGDISLTTVGLSSLANDFETLPNSFTLGVIATDGAANASIATDVNLTITDVLGGDESYILTVDIDNFGGTDLADTYIADNTVNQVSHLADQLNGGLGVDRLEMTVDSVGSIVFPSVMTAIESVNINGSGMALFDDIDTRALPSVTELTLASFDIVGDPLLNLATNQALILDTVTGRASDALRLEQEGGVQDLTLMGVNDLFIVLMGNTLQTLNLFSSGTAENTLILHSSGGILSNINISANQPISFNHSILSGSEGSTLSIDASASSAAVTMDLEIWFDRYILNILGGSGNDHFDMDESDTFDGGQGNDIAQFSVPMSSGLMNDNSLVNVETVLIGDVNLNVDAIESRFDFSEQTEDLIFEIINQGLDLIAGLGNDILSSNVGGSILTGGTGADEFRLNFSGPAYRFYENWILDFSVVEVDQLDLDGAGTKTQNISRPTEVQLLSGAVADLNETLVADAAVVIINNAASDVANANSLDLGDVASYLNDLSVGGDFKDNVEFENTSSLFYLVVSDGIDSGLFAADSSLDVVDNLTIDATELVLIATLEGVIDTSNLVNSFII